MHASASHGSTWTVAAFYAREVEIRPASFDDASTDAVQFWGLRAERPFGRVLALDLYYYGLAEGRAPEVDDRNNERICWARVC